MDHVAESAKKKHKRKARMFCKICQRFNHNTENCRKNTKDEGGNNDNEDGLDVMVEHEQSVNCLYVTANCCRSRVMIKHELFDEACNDPLVSFPCRMDLEYDAFW
jgi:hypothetical protein